MSGLLPVVNLRIGHWLPLPGVKKNRLELRVNIDEGSGFCFGVIYAVEMAEEILRTEGKLYCLGDIVHNDREVARLEAMGLTVINKEQLSQLHNEKVLIRAHGEPPETYQIAIQNNLQLIDASCPVILKLQQRIRQSFEKEEQILIYGKASHAEVIGLQGQAKGTAKVFLDPVELNPDELPEKVTLYSQTTKNKKHFREVAKEVEKLGKKVKAHDTICRQVSHRDIELQHFVKAHDVIIFVAGTKSSNGRMLYEVCLASNKKTHFVSDVSDLQKNWFRQYDSVGICGATSTPQWLMEDVKSHLLNW